MLAPPQLASALLRIPCCHAAMHPSRVHHIRSLTGQCHWVSILGSGRARGQDAKDLNITTGPPSSSCGRLAMIGRVTG
ncbi:hypothetical protein M430DRAFT_149624 [Amorphotheca resinae ATCC 22711]|jgi:hypothetical protein|uniref:Uncharacterized protein n=1 Tax=Amorphotheca resinae ATCC 22711 TaxID=857342 RepID=A0A2T3BCG8_AMORE|nr:hypothetical protein M430DRAFT_149624 [Amorphotheca resinae ATCC 22711]PSS27086.1 hypothetical protein M430DRAFT_149624 [Amorphotheca resinae ATCC 22711]